MSSYLVPASPLKVEAEVKNSVFITRVRNVTTAEQAKAFVKQMNARFPDASHHCWAYIVGNPESTTLLGCSDDGEPSGTAGKPMLHVLQHSSIGDIVVVCTRYFGGTKLGTGGLARAYGGGVKQAIEQLATETKVNYQKLSFCIDYHQVNDCQHLVKNFQIRQFKLDYLARIQVTLEVASYEFEDFKAQLTDQLKGKIEWNITP